MNTIKTLLKILGGILLIAAISLPLWFCWLRSTFYNQQDNQKQLVTIVMVDSTTTQEFVPSSSRGDGGDIFDVIHYTVTYQDSTGSTYHRLPVTSSSIPKLGPAQIVKKVGRRVWLKNLN